MNHRPGLDTPLFRQVSQVMLERRFVEWRTAELIAKRSQMASHVRSFEMFVHRIRIVRLRIRQEGPSALHVVREAFSRAASSSANTRPHPCEFVTGQRLAP